MPAGPAGAATIPGLFNTGIGTNGALLPSGTVDPHYRLIQSADPSFRGPNAFPVNDSGFPIPPWLANGPNSKWIAPQANQGTGNQPGDYRYRLLFDLTGLDPTTAVITGRWSSDNTGPDVLLNGVSTGVTSDGNFAALGNPFTISSGFLDGTNTLDFIVNNGAPGINPTGFRAEISGTADPLPPPGTPPSITIEPVSQTNGLGESVTFTVRATGSRPLTYLWRFNSNPIANATNAALTLNGLTLQDAGNYDVLVNNPWGTATSSSATLAVVFLSPAQLSYEPLGPSSRRTGLAFSEIMFHPADRGDGTNLEFIEIYNSNPFPEDLSGYRLSGDVDYLFPAGTSVPGLGFLVVAPVPEDVQNAYGISGVVGGFTNNLPDDSGTIRLRKRSDAIVLEVNYSDRSPWPVAADGTGHSLVLARPSYGENNPRAWASSAFNGGSPGAPDPVPVGPLENVVINEILAHTDLPLLDYIELHNHSPLPVNVSGCWLSDDPATNKFRIPDNTTLAANGFISFDESQLGFALSAEGEMICLVNSNQTRLIDALRFGGQANAVSFGRFPDGAPTFHALANLTPGQPNAPLLVRDVVINEIMYQPISGSGDDEYVELHNRGANPVSVGGWRFISAIRFTLPTNTVIPAGGFLVVAKNASRLMTNYAGLNSGNLVGNFSGALAEGGERLALAMPDTLVQTNATNSILTTNVFYIVVDEVIYAAGGRWGRWADGLGSSLELIDPLGDHRLAPNWADSDESAKAPWTLVETTGVLDLGHPSQSSADQLQVFLLGPGEALLDDVEVLVSGVNRIPNPGFESGMTGWFPQGTQRLTSWETNGGFNSARSLHLVATERGDHVANRVRAPLSSVIPANTSVTIRAKVRWLRGHPEILLRLKGNFLEAFGRLNLPPNLGTPGERNSRAVNNAGPAISDVSHRPILPQPGQAIRVTARVHDPDGLQSVTLLYRIDPDTTLASVAMTDTGLNGDALAGDGIYTGLIPGQPAGKLIAFRIEATDAFIPGATARFPTDAPTRECLVQTGESMPPGAFGTYRFWMTQAAHTFWSNREKMSNENLDTTFVYGTNRVVYNVGAHYSGSSYTAPIYTTPTGALCGYDLQFPEDDAVLGETHFTLDWPIRDDTNQREQLMFWFLEQYGLPNLYRRYINLYVNGVKRGAIYDDVQQPGGATLEEWFSNDSEGSLFKTDCWNEFDDAGNRMDPCILNSLENFTTTGGLKKTARYRWNWRPRAVHGSANDFSPLFALVGAVNAQVPGYQSAVECQVDVEHWMRTFAMNDLASFWDAFGNPNAKNTYLYKPAKDGWKLLCWDFDVGLGVFNDPVDAPLFPGLNDPTIPRMYGTPVFVRAYWRALEEALNGFFRTGPGTALDAVLDTKYAAFQANGISLNSPAAVKSWINQRRAFLQTQLNTVSNVFNVSGTNYFSTNRNLITLTGTAPVGVHTIVVNGVPRPVTWTTVTAWRITIPVTAGTNALTIQGLDRLGNALANASAALTVNYTGTDESAENSIVINEIMYNPVVPEASYVELYNRSPSYSFDLSNWRLNGADFTFPPGTILTNGQFLVIVKNRSAFGSAYGYSIPALCEFKGQLDDGGETLTLIMPGPSPEQDVVVSRVNYDDDPPWPVAADGHGAALQLIDPAQDASRVSNWSDGAGWRFVSYTGTIQGSTTVSAQGTNLFVFLNAAGDVFIDDIKLVTGNVADAGTNLLINGDFESALSGPWAAGGNHSNSVISTAVSHSGLASLHVISTAAGGPSATTSIRQVIPGATNNYTATLSYWFLPSTNAGVLTMRSAPGSSMIYSNGVRLAASTPGAANSVASALPPYPPLWLSEVQPENISGITDNFGDRDPWIEIFNAGDLALNLDGAFLANNFTNLAQWAFPTGTVIGAGQYLVVWADDEPGETAGADWHTNFRLNPSSGSVALSRLAGGSLQLLDFFNYTNVAADRSFGAFPPGQASDRQTFYYATPARTNDPSAPSVILFINEWMAANASFLPDSTDQHFDDWFELYNPNNYTVDLGGYNLTDTFTNSTKFTIPPQITIPPLGYLLVWADQDGGPNWTNGDLHVNFKLSQGGEAIGLYSPDGRPVDAITFGPQTDNVSEGRWPDGNAGPFYAMPTPTPRGPNVIPNARPTIVGAALEPGNRVTLTWSAQPGNVYRVQYKNALSDPAWTDLPNDVSATTTTASTADDTASGVSQRFYRILLVP